MATYKNGTFECEIDVTDYRVMERFETALTDMGSKAASAKGVTPASAAMRIMVEATTDFIDAVLGDGACNAIFGVEITSYEAALSVAQSIVEFYRDSSTDSASRISAAVAKYAPNRAARRAGK